MRSSRLMIGSLVVGLGFTGLSATAVRGDTRVHSKTVSCAASEFVPVWSRASGLIAFQCGFVEPSVYVADPSTGRQRRVGSGEFPTWSPDGRRIAFETDEEIVAVDLNSGHRTRIAAGAFPIWSPDGRSILYTGEVQVGDQAADRLCVVTLAGRRRRCLATAAFSGEPAWSPDGAKIAFATVGGQIAIADRDGGRVRAVTSGGGTRESPSWSPDGRVIAFEFARTDNDKPSVMLAWSDGSGERRLTGGSFPAFSPDGTHIAFERVDFVGSVWVIGADGSGLRRLADGRTTDNHSAAWSRDGHTLALVRERPIGTGRAAIWLVRRDGTHLRPLSSR